ncbi:MAG: hypothetical protein IJ072_05105 [Oscillospiraceae bacterium]|nr:hypothetical protein [Oscillospiraceae bacterium]
MKIEILYPSVCGLYGDNGNTILLQQCLPEAEFIFTELPNAPYFAENHVDMVYMGSMSEKMQPLVVKSLTPYKERMANMVKAGIVFLITGNTVDIFAKEVENTTAGKKFEGLGIFDLTAKIDLFDRRNGNVIGKFEDMEIIGCKSQFSMLYGDNSGFAFMQNERGAGINSGTKYEGVRRNNFFGVHLLGPFLVQNPMFTKYLLHLLEYDGEIPFYEDMMKAYRIRLAQLKSYRDSAFFT